MFEHRELVLLGIEIEGYLRRKTPIKCNVLVRPFVRACFVDGWPHETKRVMIYAVCQNEIKDFLCNFYTHTQLALASTLCRVGKGIGIVAIENVIIFLKKKG